MNINECEDNTLKLPSIN